MCREKSGVDWKRDREYSAVYIRRNTKNLQTITYLMVLARLFGFCYGHEFIGKKGVSSRRERERWMDG